MVKNLPAVQETWVPPWAWKIPWGRAWQPTPIFLPGEFHGQRKLVGYSPWDHKEQDTTEQLSKQAPTHRQCWVGQGSPSALSQQRIDPSLGRNRAQTPCRQLALKKSKGKCRSKHNQFALAKLNSHFSVSLGPAEQRHRGIGQECYPLPFHMEGNIGMGKRYHSQCCKYHAIWGWEGREQIYIPIAQYNPLNRYQENVLCKLPLKILRIRFLIMQQSTIPEVNNTRAFIWGQNFTTIYSSN